MPFRTWRSILPVTGRICMYHRYTYLELGNSYRPCSYELCLGITMISWGRKNSSVMWRSYTLFFCWVGSYCLAMCHSICRWRVRVGSKGFYGLKIEYKIWMKARFKRRKALQVSSFFIGIQILLPHLTVQIFSQRNKTLTTTQNVIHHPYLNRQHSLLPHQTLPSTLIN